MSEYFILPFVNNLLCASHRQIKFFRKPFESDPVKQSSPEDLPVSFCILAYDPFMNQQFNITPAQIGKGHLAFTLPVPWHMLHFL